MTAPQEPGWYLDRSYASGIAVATPQPKDDPFYSYTDPLDNIAPGTVLKTRRFHYHFFGFPTLLETTQLLYRSTSQTGKPTVNVTSITRRSLTLRTRSCAEPEVGASCSAHPRPQPRATCQNSSVSPRPAFRMSNSHLSSSAKRRERQRSAKAHAGNSSSQPPPCRPS